MAHLLITGASSGIGAELARQFAAKGYAIGLVARREEKLKALTEELQQAGHSAAWAAADVSDAEATADAVASLTEQLGPVDVAIANAGIGDPTPAKNFEPARFSRVMRVNVEGTTNLFSAVLPSMLERKSGQLVAVSSIAGFAGLPGSAGYCASKAAVNTLMQSFEFELRPRGIRTTTIHPGFIETPMTERNKFPMPFIMPVERAGHIIVRGVLKKKRIISFPWPMVMFMRTMQHLPHWLLQRFMRPRR